MFGVTEAEVGGSAVIWSVVSPSSCERWRARNSSSLSISFLVGVECASGGDEAREVDRLEPIRMGRESWREVGSELAREEDDGRCLVGRCERVRRAR